MVRVELVKALHRWRLWTLALVLAAVPVLLVTSLVISPPDAGGDGPPFLTQTLRNGLFAPLVTLFVIQPFLLPLTAALLAGDAIAGEASAGVLRYLLIRPVDRRWLVVAKFLSVVTLLGALLLWTVVVALTAGGLAFDLGALPSLSGTTLSVDEALARIAAAAGYVLAGVVTLAAIGLFISTLTDSGPGATAATVAVAIIVQILGALSPLEPLHPWLFSHHWFAFVELFRSPITTDPILQGLAVFAAYAAIFVTAAALILRNRDILS